MGIDILQILLHRLPSAYTFDGRVRKTEKQGKNSSPFQFVHCQLKSDPSVHDASASPFLPADEIVSDGVDGVETDEENWE